MRLRTTAPPRRPEVTNPARHGAEFSNSIAFSIKSLPRCVIPLRFTRSYSERCVRRRVLGKDNEPNFVFRVTTTCICAWTSCRKTQPRFVIQPCVQKKSSTEIGGRLPKNSSVYCCEGDSAGVSSVPAAESGLPAEASVGAGLVASVVAGGGVVGVGLVAGATVSFFCSHAASSAALASIQMYFFISWRRTLL
jgi:hypothetical protein